MLQITAKGRWHPAWARECSLAGEGSVLFIPPFLWVGFLPHSLFLQQFSEDNLEPLRYKEVSQWYLIYSFPYPMCEISQLFFPDGLNASHSVRLHYRELLKNSNNETSLVLFIQRVKPNLWRFYHLFSTQEWNINTQNTQVLCSSKLSPVNKPLPPVRD